MEVPCSACNTTGTGSDGNPCLICSGDGEINLLDDNFPHIRKREKMRGIIWDAMLTRLDEICCPTDVFESYLVAPCLNGTEYDALTDTQKEGVKIILSCGRVDLSDGASMKTRLWNWFGAESTTVANLTALLT